MCVYIYTHVNIYVCLPYVNAYFCICIFVGTIGINRFGDVSFKNKTPSYFTSKRRVYSGIRGLQSGPNKLRQNRRQVQGTKERCASLRRRGQLGGCQKLKSVGLTRELDVWWVFVG